MFQVGDKVEWVSQSQGVTKTKTGTVIEVISANADFSFQRLWHFMDKYKCQFGVGRRSDESYLVEVNDGKTEKAMPKLYRPKTGLLRKVE